MDPNTVTNFARSSRDSAFFLVASAFSTAVSTHYDFTSETNVALGFVMFFGLAVGYRFLRKFAPWAVTDPDVTNQAGD